MNREVFGPLVTTTLRAPHDAAEMLIAWRLGRDVLWTGLFLVALVNTALFLITLQTTPQLMPLPVDASQPLAMYILIAGMLVISVHALHATGRAIGGEGQFEDVLVVLVWFQTLRAIVQTVMLVLGFLLPTLANLLALVVVVWGLWIFVSFVTTATRVPSLLHAVGVIILAGTVLIIGLGFLSALIGAVF